MRISFKLLFPLAMFAALPALAQNPPPDQGQQPPAQPAQNAPPALVGRVAYVSGNVAIFQLGQTDWTKAAINLPVASGDWYATDKDARAELRIGPDSVDLAEGTELNFADLREGVMDLALSQGRADLHIRELGKGESDEIDLPIGGVWLLQRGIYDVALGASGQPTRIAVFEGSAHFAGGGVDKTINSGETLVLNGSGAKLTATIEKAAPDQFADWCRSRQYDQAKLAAPYHVSPRMTGYEELDSYGRWTTVRDYGTVWYPSDVPVGWVPYRDGYWDWGGPWGWTWVSYEPWGFAPFHYGRWAYVDGLWGWVPGAYVTAPVYAPALVGWIGDPGLVVATAFSGAAVGWFPLGPGEAYYPSYTGNLNYLRAVNAGVVSNAAALTAAPANGALQGQFANRRFATVVPQQTFTSGTAVTRAALPVSDPAVRQAAVTARPNAAQPGRAGATGNIAAARGAARAPAAPNFAHLGGPAGRSGGTPPGEPNFAHLSPTPHNGAAAAGAAAGGARAGTAAGTAGAGTAAAARAGAATAGAATAMHGGRFGSGQFQGHRFAAARFAGRSTAAGSHFAGGRRASPAHAATARTAGPRFGGARFGGGRFGGARMAAPHFAAPHFAAPRMGGAHFGGGGPHFGGGGPHFGGGGPHFGGGGPHFGGGLNAGGGGGPHGGGGGPHGGGGGGPHGGGGGGPHGGGGGGKHG